MLIAQERAVARATACMHGRWVGPLLLPFVAGLSSRASCRVCVRPIIADDGLYRTYGERGAFLAAYGKRNGAQNHTVLRRLKRIAYALSRVALHRTYEVVHLITGVPKAAVLSKTKLLLFDRVVGAGGLGRRVALAFAILRDRRTLKPRAP